MKIRTTVSTFAVSTVLLVLAGCSSTPKEVGNAARGEVKPTTTASIEAKQVAAEQEAAYVVEIEFPLKSAVLGAGAKAKVDALYKTVARPQRLKSVKVISWADDEYPSKKERKLNGVEMDLAKKRGEAVQNFLKTRNANLEFELYNMAQRPGTFSEFVGSADARIKNSLERAGVSTTEEKSTSKARKVIVMLLMSEGQS